MLTVSDTAWSIAQIRANEALLPASERLFDDPYASLSAAAVTVPPRVGYVPCDLASPDLDAALLAPFVARGFRPGAGALFVWEGVVANVAGAADRVNVLSLALRAP